MENDPELAFASIIFIIFVAAGECFNNAGKFVKICGVSHKNDICT